MKLSIINTIHYRNSNRKEGTSTDFLFRPSTSVVVDSESAGFCGDRSASTINKIIGIKDVILLLYYFQIIRLNYPKRSMSFELKERGNRLYKEGDYNGAEELFSQACVSLYSCIHFGPLKRSPTIGSRRIPANQPSSPTAP